MIKKSTTMMKFSSGVELSEATVISALKKAGISVEPPKPKHIFKAGDVARNSGGDWRFIVKIDSKLYSVNRCGFVESHSQDQFESNGYEYIDKQSNVVT